MYTMHIFAHIMGILKFKIFILILYGLFKKYTISYKI
jgi:hypothetical protein